MKHRQKCISLFLTLALLLSLTSPVVTAAEQGVKLTMEPEQENVMIGDTVSVRIRTENAFETCGCGITVYFDAAVLQPVLSDCDAAAPFAVSGPHTVSGRTALRISFLPGQETHSFEAKTLLATLRFKALTDAEKTTVSMGEAFLYDASLQELPVVMPSDLHISVQRGADSGYTVTMPGDASVTIGDTIQIPVSIGHVDGITRYNAFDISLTYDQNVLELVTANLPGVTISAVNGKLNVLCYGEPRDAGSVPFVLKFRALKVGDGSICITSARVDHSENAVMQNAPQATLVDGETKIRVTGYPVSLPGGFSGNHTAVPDQDYTFYRPDDVMEYTVTATVNASAVPVNDNGDGSYTIPGKYVTGPILVKAAYAGKFFRVTLDTDLTGETKAQFGVDYTATLHKEAGYTYSVRITINGRGYSGYGIYSGQYVIPGRDINGDIVFAVTKTKIEHNAPEHVEVMFEGSGAGAAEECEQIVQIGGSYAVVLKEEQGYSYQVSYRLPDGTLVAVQPGDDGIYLIENVTEPLVIVIEKTLDIRISVHTFVNLDEMTVFLVLASAELEEGKILTFGGAPMYYSSRYGAWVYLEISEDPTVNKDEFAVQSGQRTQIGTDCDVNASGEVDINDVQLVYDIYNARHETFEHVSILKFIYADINGDKTVNVQDAAALVGIILAGKEGRA